MGIGWAELGMKGVTRVRDVWRQIDLDGTRDGFESLIPAHGVAVIRVITSGGGMEAR